MKKIYSSTNMQKNNCAALGVCARKVAMFWILIGALVGVAVLWVAGTAGAVSMTYSYSFTGSNFTDTSFNGLGAQIPPDDPIAGSFSFTTDNSVANFEFAPDTVSLTISGFTYSIGNTAVDFDPTFGIVLLGGIANGGNNSGFAGTDDFFVNYRIDPLTGDVTSSRGIGYSTSGTIDTFNSGTESITFNTSGTPVPEPATMTLLGIGLVGLAGGAARRRRKKKAVEKS